MVDFCFQAGAHEQLSVNKVSARWVSKNHKSGLRFSREAIEDEIKYLIDNAYFTLVEKLFRQIVGLPMGSDPAPFMANFLCIISKANG